MIGSHNCQLGVVLHVCCWFHLYVAPSNVSIRHALLPLWLVPCYRRGWAYLSTHCVRSLCQPMLANKSRVNVMCVCVCMPVLDSMCKCVCVSWRWFSEPLRETLANEDFLHLPHSLLIPDKVFNLLAWPGPSSDPSDLCPEDVEGSGRPLPWQPQRDKINSGLKPNSLPNVS